jgi:hypothetical protein
VKLPILFVVNLTMVLLSSKVMEPVSREGKPVPVIVMRVPGVAAEGSIVSFGFTMNCTFIGSLW